MIDLNGMKDLVLECGWVAADVRENNHKKVHKMTIHRNGAGWRVLCFDGDGVLSVEHAFGHSTHCSFELADPKCFDYLREYLISGWKEHRIKRIMAE